MKELLIFRLFLRDLKKQKKRITLTIMAITWGTISIVMLMAFGEGLKRSLNKARHGMGKDIVVLWGDRLLSPTGDWEREEGFVSWMRTWSF